MRIITIGIICCLTFTCCNSASEKKSGQVDRSKTSNQVNGKKFFVYDAIDYYTNDFDEAKVEELYDNQSKTEIDSFKEGIILGNIPKSISDLGFIDKLVKIGYKKASIPKSKFAGIDSIFVEKTTVENIATTCIYIYRDILVFKNKNTVVGTAKVCFGCMANQIHGTTVHTENFGQDGDYDRLFKVLRK